MNSRFKFIGVIAAATLGTAALAGCDPNQANSLISQAAHDASQIASEANSSPSAGSTTTSTTGQSMSYSFQTLNDPGDTTFNQLLGISGKGIIAGYFGSGMAGHPNKGYRLSEHADTDFVSENFPGAVQTQVIGVNDSDLTVGFFSTMNNSNNMNANAGFYRDNGYYHDVVFPTSDNANPSVNQLLGVNDRDTAVGFYTDSKGNNHGYEYCIQTHKFTTITVSGEGATSVTVAGINNHDDVVGFFTGSGGAQDAFLRTDGGTQTVLAYPGATMTQAFGVNDNGEVVGTYTVGTGSSAMTHGFTWTASGSFHALDDPSGVGATTVNGVNNQGQIVGFYTDSAGNTDGMLATPSSGQSDTMPSAGGSSSMPSASASASPSMSSSGMSGSMSSGEQLTLHTMPQGTVMLSEGSNGTVQAQVNVTGLTPGSQHVVEIDRANSNDPDIEFQPLTVGSNGAANATLSSNASANEIPSGGYFIIRLGASTSDENRSAEASEAIAEAGPLSGNGSQQLQLNGLDVNASGQTQGQLTATATVTFNASAQTITVTLTASGLTPGAHTAQLDSGSCQSQGSSKGTLSDFQADSNGYISNQSRTITGVTSAPTSGSWYLNLLQGDSGSIMDNGSPALSFRPLLCANG